MFKKILVSSLLCLALVGFAGCADSTKNMSGKCDSAKKVEKKCGAGKCDSAKKAEKKCGQ
ncbi:MAG: hypothetical protein ABXS92_06825 [Sulfurimonas sp.]